MEAELVVMLHYKSGEGNRDWILDIRLFTTLP